jgi:4-hydroxybenzoate polyprenyltransferase
MDILLKREAIPHYIKLMRLDRPIGIYLLLWPTITALWLASEGIPDIKTLAIFIAGVICMRSAGCVVNDLADRKIDGHVERTHQRPLASGLVSEKEALALFFILLFISFLLVLQTNATTIRLSVIAVLLAASYPFMKRYTYLPQVVLGAAFAWAIPMAYTALDAPLQNSTWLLFSATVLWTVAYDTLYAMVDREDDLKIGVRSTAILFGENDRFMVGLIQALTLLSWIMLGTQVKLGLFWWLGVCGATALFVYQQWLIRHRDRDACFKAFLHNNWVGLLLFLAMVLNFL